MNCYSGGNLHLPSQGQEDDSKLQSGFLIPEPVQNTQNISTEEPFETKDIKLSEFDENR